MCWFIWFFDTKKDMRSERDSGLEKISHRGRYTSCYDFSRLCVGYSRLPTDDIENRKLDFSNDFLFNGIITNVDDLCELFHLSESCKSSDTLTLKEGFSRYREKFLEHVRGMFAFSAIYNSVIYLVRDTIGIKPLYFSISESWFSFSSEIKWLLGQKEIFELLPGTILKYDMKTGVYDFSQFQYSSYKNYTPEIKNISLCLEESYITSLKRYIAHGKKVGLLLSGGIDSTLLYQLIRVKAPELVSSVIPYVLANKKSSDKEQVLKLAKDLGFQVRVIHHESPLESFKKLSKIIYYFESPIPRVIKVGILQYKIAEAIRTDNIDVVISGEGADEIFYGYERFYLKKTKQESEFLFERFFRKIFFHTLLQRLDRAFSLFTIEARVPFLDQELIELAKKFSYEEKVWLFHGVPSQKLPLRKLGEILWLPDYICERPKVKMTLGVTKKHNSEKDMHGYLEDIIFQKTGKHSKQYFEELYMQYYSKDGEHFFKNYNTYLQEPNY